MVENIRLSFQGIWAHKLRSFLTMLGIIIGIASIISIVSTIKGTNEQIKMNLIGEGDNVVDTNRDGFIFRRFRLLENGDFESYTFNESDPEKTCEDTAGVDEAPKDDLDLDSLL